MKRLSLLAALALTGALTAGCGGGGSAPTDASTDDFCTAMGAITKIDSNASEDAQAAKAHDIADKLNSTGTPKDISDDARKGFEKYVDILDGISASDIKDQNFDPTKGMSSDENKQFEAFVSYTTKTCPDMGN